MRTLSKHLVPPRESRVDFEDIEEVPNGGMDDVIGGYLR